MTRTHVLLLGVAGVVTSSFLPPLTYVSHDTTLRGNGTSASPLGIARNGVGREQLANGSVEVSAIRTGNVPTAGQVLGFNGNRLSWLTPVSGGGGALQVVDSEGVAMGPLFPGAVGLKVGNQWLLLQLNGAGILNNGVFLFYESTDCSGTAYATAGSLPPYVQHQDTQSYYPAAPYQVLALNSATFNGSCGPFATTDLVGVATPLPVDLSSFVPPFSVQSQ